MTIGIRVPKKEIPLLEEIKKILESWKTDEEGRFIIIVERVNNTVNVKVLNFPQNYPLPESQFDALAKESTLQNVNSDINDISYQYDESYFKAYAWNGSNYQLVEGYIKERKYEYDENGNLTVEQITIVNSSGGIVATVKKTYTYENENVIKESHWEVIV